MTEQGGAPDGANAADAAAIEQGAAVVATLETNRRAVVSKASRALADLGAVVALSDAAINANPAAQVRTVARALRLILRLELDRYEGTD